MGLLFLAMFTVNDVMAPFVYLRVHLLASRLTLSVQSVELRFTFLLVFFT